MCEILFMFHGQLLHSAHFQHDGLSENIFTQQPSYYNDLDETVATVLQARARFLHFTEKYPNVTIPNEKHIVSVGEYLNALLTFNTVSTSGI